MVAATVLSWPPCFHLFALFQVCTPWVSAWSMPMVDTPVVGISGVFLLLLFAFHGQDLLPGFIFILFDLVIFVLLILVVLTSLTFLVLVSLSSSSHKLGSELELPLELIDGGCHGDNLVIFEGLGSPLT